MYKALIQLLKNMQTSYCRPGDPYWGRLC